VTEISGVPAYNPLMRDGQPVYYAFANGHDKPPIEGSLSAVELALGLRLSATPSAKPAPRDFDVTVTPRMLTYGSHGTNGAYTVPVIATTRAEAIKQARADRDDQEGRFAVPADYRARLRKP